MTNNEKICACGCGQIVHLKTDKYTMEKHSQRNRYFWGKHYIFHLTKKFNKNKTAIKNKIRYKENDEAITEHYKWLIDNNYIVEVPTK